MKTVTVPATELSRQMVKEIGRKVITNIVAAPEGGTAEEKARVFLADIAEKCCHCQLDTQGEVFLNAIVDCSDHNCPLNSFGPMVFKIIRAEVDNRSDITARLQ